MLKHTQLKRGVRLAVLGGHFMVRVHCPAGLLARLLPGLFMKCYPEVDKSIIQSKKQLSDDGNDVYITCK